MSPRAHNRLKPKPPDADADYIRAWNDGWEAGGLHAYGNMDWIMKKAGKREITIVLPAGTVFESSVSKRGRK